MKELKEIVITGKRVILYEGDKKSQYAISMDMLQNPVLNINNGYLETVLLPHGNWTKAGWSDDIKITDFMRMFKLSKFKATLFSDLISGALDTPHLILICK